MLNISFYRGVPLQTDYKNVLDISQTNFDTFLSQYYVNSVNGIAVRFDNTNSIVLREYFENCNYMRIEDTNAVQQIKFYFISSCSFVSGNVKYNLICDIWHTYKYNITNFYKSLMIEGHADVLNVREGVFNYKTFNKLTYEDTNRFSNKLINKVYLEGNDPTPLDIIAFVATDDGVKIIENQLTGLYVIGEYLSLLYQNKYVDENGTDKTYEILHIYIIPNFDLTVYMTKNQNNIRIGTSSFGYTAHLYQMWYEWEEPAGHMHHTTNLIMSKIIIATDYIFKTNITNSYQNRITKAHIRFVIGAFNNYKELDTPFNLNDANRMTLELNIYETFNAQILLKFGKNVIDLTNYFELPINNDSYNLYMNTNKQQIETANKTNYLNYLMSVGGIVAGVALAPATAGASTVLAGAGIATATASLISKEMQSNARLEDAKNSIDRCDNALTNLSYMFDYGVGVFEIYCNEENIETNYNKFGTTNNCYINDYKPTNANLYNFYYIQLQNANFAGTFNEEIKNTIKSIFENGVRIWCDYTKFLNFDTHYIK